jgi:hypothetical protein
LESEIFQVLHFLMKGNLVVSKEQDDKEDEVSNEEESVSMKKLLLQDY